MTRTMTQPKERTTYQRFPASQRFEHLVLLLAFIGLAITGLAQKFGGEAWSRIVIQVLGGAESIRILHRFLAVLVIAEATYHVGAASYRLFVLRQRATMLPGLRDLRDLVSSVLYGLGLRAEPPRMPHYNFRNKLEYWLVALSLVILIVTGLMLWNPITTSRILAGETIPAVQAIHGDQALLIVLIVGIWHMYNVLIRRPNFSIFTGYLSRQAMLEEHAEELDCADQPEPAAADPSSESFVRRKQVFWRVSAAAAILLIGGLVWFLNYERNTIDTVPRRSAGFFAGGVKPITGDASVGAALWTTSRCAFCHGPQANGGVDKQPALVGTSLTYDKFYRQVRTGSDNMPAFRTDEVPDAYLAHVWAWLMAQSTF